MSNFAKYSTYYDLLYRDKDYAGEAAYVARKIRLVLPSARSILEFDSGTGRHGRLLAGMGFDVHGVERSVDMVAIARAAAQGEEAFTCETGDIRGVELGRSFDAVVALFHVISYQATDEDLRAAFAAAARHLKPGGVFLFDVWHGPAVMAERPSERVMTVADERFRVTRTARPEHDADRSTVKVGYDMECVDVTLGAVSRFHEDHLMRYLFPTEIERLAQDCGMRVLGAEEFQSGRAPSTSSWSVAYLLQKPPFA